MKPTDAQRRRYHDEIVKMAREARDTARQWPLVRHEARTVLAFLHEARDWLRKGGDRAGYLVWMGNARVVSERMHWFAHELGADEETRAIRGRQLDGARAALKAVTADQRSVARATAAQLRRANPALSGKDIARRLAPEFAVSTRTIERWLAD
jgi:hypothetical protein